ncbi:MAG: hypothetical protein AAGJ68_11830 [Pseudomonadota bacterium]
MSLKQTALVAASFALVACASAQPDPSTQDHACPAEIEQLFSSLTGDWTLAIRADEGWTGYGESTFIRTSDPSCGVGEATFSVFNQESENPMEVQSSAILAYDKLSKTIKILTGDDRGYTHIGIASPEMPITFDVIQSTGEAPVRQIQYKNMEDGAFEWSWRGRASATEPWADRLVISYTKTQ